MEVTNLRKKVRMNVARVNWYSQSFLRPVKLLINGLVVGGTAKKDHFNPLEHCVRANQSTATPIPMASRTLPKVIFKTVPFHFLHNHRPFGSYSQIMGRFTWPEATHSVNLSSRPLLQPGLDGIPIPSKILGDGTVNNFGCCRVVAVDIAACRCGEVKAPQTLFVANNIGKINVLLHMMNK